MLGKRYSMIQISGNPFSKLTCGRLAALKVLITQRMIKDPTVYSYQSIDQLSFEIKLRKNIILSARVHESK